MRTKFASLAVTAFAAVLSLVLQLNVNGALIRFYPDASTEEARKELVSTLALFSLGWSLALVIGLNLEIAPLTSSALAALANRRFYDGLTFHRVVPDFVVQGGDPRGDGDGGPGWSLPDEHSALRFLRGTLGIATNGPETGGSQFFLCHSAQPHLDGRYTIAGELREGADVMDALQPGDTILSATAE